MTPANAAPQAAATWFTQMELQLLLRSAERLDSCMSREELAIAAQSSLENLETTTRRHVEHCTSCASVYAAFRGSYLPTVLPDDWDVALCTPRGDIGTAFDDPIFFRISLETR